MSETKYLLFTRNSDRIYYVEPKDFVEVLPDDGGLKDADGDYLAWNNWVFKDDVINAIENTGYVVEDTYPDIKWDDPEEVEDWDWYPGLFFSDNYNYHLIVGEDVEKIEVLDEKILEDYKFGYIMKVKFKDSSGKIKEGYVDVSRYARDYPVFYYNLEDLEKNI
jgi:hypothetical protein